MAIRSFAGILLISATLLFAFCKTSSSKQNEEPEKEEQQTNYDVVIEMKNFIDSSGSIIISQSGEKSFAQIESAGWLSFNVNIPVAGRYSSSVTYTKTGNKKASVWLEDYIDNKDDRTYDITGKMILSKSSNPVIVSKDGSPLDKGLHKMKLHITGDSIQIQGVQFKLLKKHKPSPKVLKQNMEGDEWVIAWSDEFDGSGIPDTSKWTFDLGDWGWGNNEVQYYTEFKKENARLEDGSLIIEARKNDYGKNWTSARLTTRGKVAFTYGKIELRAMVPAKKGCWAAGWTLGNEYVDEISWPYCGEIDILESVGFETDDETGDGMAHSTVHSGAFYFKKGNHITGKIPVEDISEEFHIYAVEWDKNEIKTFVDGKHFYTYDKTGDELEWPFNKPQNIILNLTMGGGWGGPIDTSITSQKYLIDYVRVYEKK